MYFFRALVSRWIRGVFLLSACEPLDQRCVSFERLWAVGSAVCVSFQGLWAVVCPTMKKHTDRVFPSCAWEPLDQAKETHRWSNGSQALEGNTRSVCFFSPGWCYQPGLVIKIQQLTSPQKKHTPDPTAHKRLKETHDPCASQKMTILNNQSHDPCVKDGHIITNYVTGMFS